MKAIYPVLFYEEKEGGYSVFVPDLQNKSTCGSTLEEAMSMAEDLIAGIVLDEMEESSNEYMLYDFHNVFLQRQYSYLALKKKNLFQLQVLLVHNQLFHIYFLYSY